MPALPILVNCLGFPGGSDSKKFYPQCRTCSAGSIPGLGQSPGEGNGNLLQHSYLENFMHRGAWWATIHGVTNSWTQVSDSHFL